MIEEKIVIDNLKCGGCANTITKSLKELDGVQHVAVDLGTTTVVVTANEKVTRAMLLEKLSKLGYPELGTSNVLQKAKSYVSCAIGKLEN